MKAKYIQEISVDDNESQHGLPVEMAVFKHENGGMFAIDSSYITQCFDDDKETIEIPDPFGSDEPLTLYNI